MTNATVKSVARATQSTARGGTTTEATVANVARETVCDDSFSTTTAASRQCSWKNRLP
jgi:hypothetical protein